MKILASVLLVLLLASGNSLAGNITIYDGISSGTGWYGSQEDNETEPGTITNQIWDLEGASLNGTQLTLVGGWNFTQGVTYGGHLYKSGDIFIDVTGDAKYGSSINFASNGFNQYGYDYVIDVNWTTGAQHTVKAK